MQVKYCQIVIFLRNRLNRFRVSCEVIIVDLASQRAFLQIIDFIPITSTQQR